MKTEHIKLKLIPTINNTTIVYINTSLKYLKCFCTFLPCFILTLNVWPSDMSQSQLAVPVPLNDIPSSIAELLNEEECWEFSILELEAATHKRYQKARLFFV